MKFLCPAFLVVFLFICPFSYSQQINPVIIDAFELRMNTKADDAVELLQNFILEDSTNSLVYFECARALCHISPVDINKGRRQSETVLKKDKQTRKTALKMIEKAIEINPNNFYFYELEQEILVSIDPTYLNKNLISSGLPFLETVMPLMDKTFDANPNIELAKAQYPVYFLQGLMDSTKADNVKIQKYREYIKENDWFENISINFVEDKNNEKLKPLEYYLQFLDSDSLNVDLLMKLGSLYLEASNIEKGIEFYEKTMLLENNFKKVYGFIWQNPGGVLSSIEWGKKPEFIKLYYEWEKNIILDFLATKPKAPYQSLAYLSLSKIYKNLGDSTNAIEMDRLAKEIEPYFYQHAHNGKTLLLHPREIIKATF